MRCGNHIVVAVVVTLQVTVVVIVNVCTVNKQ